MAPTSFIVWLLRLLLLHAIIPCTYLAVYIPLVTSVIYGTVIAIYIFQRVNSL